MRDGFSNAILNFPLDVWYDKENIRQAHRLVREVTIMTYTKDTLIGEALDADAALAEYFLEMGMHCLGCPSSRGESIEEACMVHGVSCEALLEKLNARGK